MNRLTSRMTPGPWRAVWNDSDNGVIGYQIFGKDLAVSIAEVPNINTPHGNGHANARAIACLPELVEAAREVITAEASDTQIGTAMLPSAVLDLRRILARIDGGD